MGITINGKPLGEIGGGVSRDISRIIDGMKQIPTSLYNAGVTLAREVAYETAMGCAENTPVNTGNMLMNWHISPEGDNAAYDDHLLSENHRLGKGEEAERAARQAQYLPEIESSLHMEAQQIRSEAGARNINRMTVYNLAPYASQYGTFVVEHGLDAASRVLEEWSNKKSLLVKSLMARGNK